jgi:hypothetical protein
MKLLTVVVLSRITVTLDGVLDLRLDLLTTLTHDSWLHLIIAPSLIFTLYKSLQHTLSLFSLLFPGKASNSGDSSASVLTLLLTAATKSYLQSPLQLSYNSLFYSWLTSKLVSVITSRHRSHRKHCSLLYSSRFHGNVFVCEGVTQ